MPGSCDSRFRPLLEKISGKAYGTDFGLVYNPEFIALGSVIKDFLNPDMVLFGASDKRSGGMVKELYFSTFESSPDIKVMSLVNAEITKLSLNWFVTMKISFANELASICERVPGADIDAITDALGSDTRIGSKYLKGWNSVDRVFHGTTRHSRPLPWTPGLSQSWARKLSPSIIP